jgi:hypothetical protein
VVGKYTDVTGSDAAGDCIDCLLGKYTDVSGSAGCIGCIAGKYIGVVGSDDAADCIDCIAGKYSDVVGSDAETDCIDCIAGKYNDVTGSDGTHGSNSGASSTAGWDCVFRQTVPNYKPIQDWRTFSPGDRSGDFSTLDELESSRHPDGKFTLKLVWPQRAGTNTQTWRQTSNPVTQTQSNGGVSGYESMSTPFSAMEWGGLEKGGSDSLLDGSVSSGYWWYAVGSFSPHEGGIPGPGTVETRVELWTLTPSSNELPGASYQDSEARLVHKQSSSCL